MKQLTGLIFFVLLSLIASAQVDTVETIVTLPESKRPASISEADYEQIKTLEDTLGVLSFLIINDSLAENRFASCRAFIPKLVEALKHKNSFDYSFDRLQHISILNSPDSTFRIFTWQLYVDTDEYHYYGAIQMNTPDLQLFPLSDRSHEIEGIEFEVLDMKKWYGAVYYNIKDFDTPQGKKYLLFGFDGHSFFNKRKLIDVLHFDQNNPLFGAPVFVQGTDSKEHPRHKMRVLLEYYAAASVKLNYDEIHQVIMFDNLQEMGTAENLKMIPDGTYQGYQYSPEQGAWVHIEKLFHEILDEAPRPSPIFNDETTTEKGVKPKKRKDLFGNK